MSPWRRGPVVEGCRRGDRRGNRRSVRGYACGTGLVLQWVSMAIAAVAAVLAIAGPCADVAHARATPRIVGGAGVSIADFPFQVALYDPHAGSVAAGFFCGGVIIDATHVATAAHCAIDDTTGRVTSPHNIAVMAGSGHLSELGEPSSGAGIEDPAVATSLDPSYEPVTNDYDAAVIRLAHPLWQGPTPPVDGRSS